MKKFIPATIAVVVLLVVTAFVAPSFVDWSKYKPTIQNEIQAKTGYTVNLDGDIALAILPYPHLSVENVTVLNDKEALVSLQEANISVDLIPLLSKNISISSVELVKPVISLATNKQGVGNWVVQSQEKREAQIKQDVRESQQANTGEEPKQSEFKISKLVITDGQLTYKDGVKGTTTIAKDVNVEGGLKSLNGPYDFDGSLALNDRQISFDVEAGQKDALGNMPLEALVSTDGEQVKLSFDGAVDIANKGLEGDFEVEGDDLSKYAGASLKGPFKAEGEIAYAPELISLKDLEAKLAGLNFKGDIKALEGNQRFQFNLTEASGDKGNGTLGPILSNSKMQADITLSDTRISFPSFNATLQGSTLKGNGIYTKSPAGLTLAMTADTLNLDKWMGLSGKKAPAKAKGSSGSKEANATQGFALPMNLDIDAKADTLIYQGKTYDNAVANIKGQGSALNITKLSANTAFDTSLSVSGKIADTKALSGMDLNIAMKTSDVEALAKSYDMTLPESDVTIGALDLTTALTGSLSQMQFNTTASARSLRVSANGTAKNPTTNLALEGLNVAVKHPNMVKAIQIVNPSFSMGGYWQKGLDIQTGLSMADKTITLTNLRGSAGPIPLESANLTISTGGNIPAVKGDIALGALSLPGTSSGTANKASSSGGQATSSSQESGQWSGQTIDSKWMRSVMLDLDVKAKSVAQNRWVLTSPSIDMALSNGVLDISSLSAGLFGGNVAMDGKIVANDNGQGFKSVSWNSKANSINAMQLYSAMVNRSEDLISGTINSASESLTTNGASMKALMSNLNGNAKLSGSAIGVKGIDIAGLAGALSEDIKIGDTVTGVLSSSIYKGGTSFETLEGNFDIASGIVRLNPVYLDGAKARFDLSGIVNLPAWTLDVTNKVTVKNSDVPPFDMTFKGSLSNPKRLGGDVLEDYVQRKIERKLGKIIQDQGLADKINNKLGIPLLGGSQQQQSAPDTTEPASGDQTQQQQQPQQKKPEEMLLDAVGGFLR
ncbi:MAG: hypothetical protein CMH25_02475 [Micavibrio sp.]|nr:hypothetical protein [Micavibrio sp.]|tara:strand:- start:481807 stop:484824 length:3018 start_codon:yes stop_codon:yes gene_type:complete